MTTIVIPLDTIVPSDGYSAAEAAGRIHEFTESPRRESHDPYHPFCR
jgi:hypothetical protein